MDPEASAALELPGRLTLEQKVSLLGGQDSWSLPEMPAIGLRSMKMADGPMGVRLGHMFEERTASTLAPCGSALAATWNPELIESVGALIGAVAHSLGVHVLLAPTVNLHRSPLAGRNFECYSEDPLLGGKIAAAYIRGVQSQGVAATIKHFVCNDAETERRNGSAVVDEQTLREIYLPAFEIGVRDGRPWALMTAYNRVNGTPMAEHPMLEQVLREEWGFDGVVVSDWAALLETVAPALAGLDVEMPGPPRWWGEQLVEAVRDGRVEEAAIDRKLERLLVLAGRVGLLDGVAQAERERLDPAAGPSVLREAACESFVLLRNDDGVLPLPATASLAVLGPLAIQPAVQGGGAAHLEPERVVTPLEGIRAALGDGARLVHEPGYAPAIMPRPEPGWLEALDGESGFTIEYLDAETGATLVTEQRRNDRFVWVETPSGRPILETPVRLRARLTVPVAGVYELGLSCTGAARLRIDGVQRLEVPESPYPDQFPVLFGNVAASAGVELAAGRPVELEIDFRAEQFMESRAAALSFRMRPPAPPDILDRAVAAARRADAAVVVVGLGEELEGEGRDRSSLELPREQAELVRAVCGANPRTVVVVNAGAPVVLDWAEQAPALLWAWYAGQEYGNALADVLFGAAEPGGRLPTTLPARAADAPVLSAAPDPATLEWRYEEGLFVGYRHYDRHAVEPAYCFGHGLSYTSFAYDDLRVGEVSTDGVEVALRLTNSGERRGKEVVQVYVGCELPERPLRELRDFAAVTLDPGESREVCFRLGERAFSRWDAHEHRWTRIPGPLTVAVGSSSRDLRLSAPLPA
ncbi:MAG: beta-glucosidase H [Gaiellaceae bacterium]